jgi:hypothetical protein
LERNLPESLANARYLRDCALAINSSADFATAAAARDGYRVSSILHVRAFCSQDFVTTLALLQHLPIMNGKKPPLQALMLVFRDWRDLK